MRTAVFCAWLILFCSPSVCAEKVAPAFLIVPGKSIGKITLGSDRDSVIRKMGRPYRTDRGKAQLTLLPDDFPNQEQFQEARKQSSRDVIVDVWKRPGANGSLKAIYENLVVKQISVSLEGYATAEGLKPDMKTGAIWSRFDKKFISGRDTYYYFTHGDEQSGYYPMTQTLRDYMNHGVAILSNLFTGTEMVSSDYLIYQVIVHYPGLMVLDSYGVDD